MHCMPNRFLCCHSNVYALSTGYAYLNDDAEYAHPEYTYQIHHDHISLPVQIVTRYYTVCHSHVIYLFQHDFLLSAVYFYARLTNVPNISRFLLRRLLNADRK